MISLPGTRPQWGLLPRSELWEQANTRRSLGFVSEPFRLIGREIAGMMLSLCEWVSHLKSLGFCGGNPERMREATNKGQLA
jgi:hypothetical protein